MLQVPSQFSLWSQDQQSVSMATATLHLPHPAPPGPVTHHAVPCGSYHAWCRMDCLPGTAPLGLAGPSENTAVEWPANSEHKHSEQTIVSTNTMSEYPCLSPQVLYCLELWLKTKWPVIEQLQSTPLSPTRSRKAGKISEMQAFQRTQGIQTIQCTSWAYLVQLSLETSSRLQQTKPMKAFTDLELITVIVYITLW